MTSIRVGGTVYSLQESVNGATLGDLYALKAQTRKGCCKNKGPAADECQDPTHQDCAAGVSVKTIANTFTRIGEEATVDGFNSIDLLDDDVFIQNMLGVVFLARRKAGEQITFVDASRVAFNDIEFISDDEDDEPTPLGAAAESGPAV